MAQYQIMIGDFKMPSVGLGTWRATDEEQLQNALNAALELGYRHIDTAEVYRNEAVIGKVLKEWFTSGKLKREELFVTTKLPPHAERADLVEDALKGSLEKLQLDYVDLYLIHVPIFMTKDDAGHWSPGETDHIAVWKKLEEQVDAGRTKTIGVSNFNTAQIQRVWDAARIKPACLQIELQPYLQQPELVDFCHKKKIVVVAYSSLGAGGTITLGTNEVQLPKVLEDETIKQIANKHKKSPAQTILRFFLQNNIVVIPKSVTPSRLKENFDLFGFSLDENDIKTIRGLDKGEDGRMVNFGRLIPKSRDHPEYPYPK